MALLKYSGFFEEGPPKLAEKCQRILALVFLRPRRQLRQQSEHDRLGVSVPGTVWLKFGATQVARRVIPAILLMATAGCGVTYTSPKLRADDQNAPVTVVELNQASVQVANKSSYTPRSLPQVFHSVAGNGSFVGIGALPTAPNVPNTKVKSTDHRPLPNVQPTAYHIGVGDVLLLATRGSASTVEQLSGLLAAQNQRQGYTVRDDGTIAIPEVGLVQLAGRTIQEAENQLFQGSCHVNRHLVVHVWIWA